VNAQQRVKICGISDAATARVAVEAGADYIGIVFYPGSHRYVEPARAREIADAARSAADGRGVNVVGLFVNEPLEDVLAVREMAQLDIIQLSGNETTSYMAALAERDVPYTGTVRAGGSESSDAEARFNEIVALEPHAIMLDTHVPGMWGGSGVVGDWELARDLARRYPLLLAGGLDLANVKAAVREVQPYVIDVSTGVESNKQKDHAKIKAFIAAARGAEGEER
jgi:phosphoribosylanthranilate isomerase